jgi:integrase/recombinase XerC
MTTELAPLPTDAAPLPELLKAAASLDLYAAVLAGRNARTVRAYEADYRDFARFLGTSTPAAALEALIGLPPGTANAVALSYRADLVVRDLAAATIARRLAALRSAVKLARTLGRVTWTLEVESPRSQPYRDTIACGTGGWRTLLETAKAEAGRAAAVRNLALIRTLHDLGLRRGEAVALDRASLDLERGTVAVVGKGRTEPIRLTLPDPTRAALARWCAARGDGPGPLFTRLDPAAIEPTRLTGEAVRLVVRELARRAGVAGPVRPHGLRHLAVTEVLDRNGGDIRAAQEFARHSDPKTTMRCDRNRRDLAGQMARLIAGE